MASPELQEELEALQWTYGDELHACMDDEDGCSSTQRVRTIQAKLFPNTGEREEQRFVEATLLLTDFPDSYPAAAPRLEVRDARGLGDEREQQLQVLLERERDSLLGSMMVGQIIEAGREFLTANNHPEGRCAFCLEDMVSVAGVSSQSEEGESSGLVKLPFCYHAFHKSCFVGWWAWRQHSLMQKEKELVAHAGIASPESIIAEQLPAKEEHAGWKATVFCTLCPCCRADAPLPSIRHLNKDLRVALRALLYPSKSESADKEEVGANKEKPQREGMCAPAGYNAKVIAETQARHRLIFEKQQAAGGIISSDAAVSNYSITSSNTAGGIQQGPVEAAAGCSGSQSGSMALGSGKITIATARSPGSDHTGTSAQQWNADGLGGAAAGEAAGGTSCFRAPSGQAVRGAGRGRHRHRGPKLNHQPVQGKVEASAGQQAPTWQPDPSTSLQGLHVSDGQRRSARSATEDDSQPGPGGILQGLHVSDGPQDSAAGRGLPGQSPPEHVQGRLHQGRGRHASLAANASDLAPVAASASNHQSPGQHRLQVADGYHSSSKALPDSGRQQRGRGRRGGSQGRRGGRKQEQSS